MSGEPDADAVVRLTRAQVREIDRLAIDEYHIPGVVLMENAARAVADAAAQMLGTSQASVGIVCGNGNNAGDGFAVARHLHNHGTRVTIIDTSHRLKGDARVMSLIAEAMGIERVGVQDALRVINPHAADLVIDALFGTGLTRPPEGEAAALIGLMNERGVPILAVDVPSGLDCDTGKPLGACVRAARTVTFVAEKAGFASPSAYAYTGRITVADIGSPRELIARVTG